MFFKLYIFLLLTEKRNLSLYIGSSYKVIVLAETSSSRHVNNMNHTIPASATNTVDVHVQPRKTIHYGITQTGYKLLYSICNTEITESNWNTASSLDNWTETSTNCCRTCSASAASIIKICLGGDFSSVVFCLVLVLGFCILLQDSSRQHLGYHKISGELDCVPVPPGFCKSSSKDFIPFLCIFPSKVRPEANNATSFREKPSQN